MHKHPTHRINDATSHISRRKAQPTIDIQEVKHAKKKKENIKINFLTAVLKFRGQALFTFDSPNKYKAPS